MYKTAELCFEVSNALVSIVTSNKAFGLMGTKIHFQTRERQPFPHHGNFIKNLERHCLAFECCYYMWVPKKRYM